ncbi:septal ring lytic transglycosylase RlpA family protein [Rhizobium rhizogenes]|uniref:septal ring lytic transglycosylase RlpA family protein n=1 Tax=Rhizobium rhizogenes TaxID=359 RepID=UPI00226DBB69|nr:septal ring lytic transglycosylase RlpA family protein [Rhizobium rhizogenes]
MKFENRAVTCATGMRWFALSLMCATITACGTTQKVASTRQHGKEYFSEKEYGVKASPRVVANGPVPKGGGRFMVGNPYQVKGKWYYPKEDFGYSKVGIASWYGSAFHGRLTANGEVYDQQSLTAAHPTFPLPSYARVTNVETGSSIIVRVNDRGPYHPGRIIDLSNKTAQLLDLQHSGTGDVRVQYVGRARMDGHDEPYLMASYIPKGSRLPSINPGGQIATGVMVASAGRMTADQLPDSDTPTPTRNSRQVRSFDATPAIAPIPRQSPYATTAFADAPKPAYNNDKRNNNPPPMMWNGGAMPSVESAQPVMIVLPQIGPIPRERPDFTPRMASLGDQSLGSTVAAYQNTPVKTVYVDLAFDAVMVRNDGLTQESILSAYHRQRQGTTQAD